MKKSYKKPHPQWAKTNCVPFEKLPDGYTFDLRCTPGTNSLGQRRYGVTIIKPDGKRIDLIGNLDLPVCFPPTPDTLYRLGDVRNTLVKEKIGDGEEYHYHLYGMDARTRKYLDAIEEKIGLTALVYDDEVSFEGWDNLGHVAINASDLYVSPSADDSGIWRAGYVIQHDIDDVGVYIYEFAKKPNKDKVKTAELISTIEDTFGDGKVIASFTCWECGGKVAHWLDLDGGLEEKWSKLSDKYCGC
jgi:hypothetical protein